MTLQAHGGKHSCPYCEGQSTLECGKMRTFGLLKQRYNAFVDAGSALKKAQLFANVIHPALLHYPDHELVLYAIPPPPLHMMIGGADAILSVIVKIKGEKLFVFFSCITISIRRCVHLSHTS